MAGKARGEYLMAYFGLLLVVVFAAVLIHSRLGECSPVGNDGNLTVQKREPMRKEGIETVQNYPCAGSTLLDLLSASFGLASASGTYIEPHGWAEATNCQKILRWCDDCSNCSWVIFEYVERDTTKTIEWVVDRKSGAVYAANQLGHTWLTTCRTQ